MKPVVRRMRPEDLPAVVRIDQLSLPLPWSERAYRRELENEYTRAWVAEVTADSQLVYPPAAGEPGPDLVVPAGQPAVAGFLILWMVIDEAHIATVAVHPGARRHGLARRLLRQALAAARQEGALQALLEVRAGNHAAQALYAGFDFEVVGRRPRYYLDNQEDALLMTLPRLDGLPAEEEMA